MSAHEISAGVVLGARGLIEYEASKGRRYAFISLDRRSPRGHALAVAISKDASLDRFGHTFLVVPEAEVRALFRLPDRSTPPLAPGERLTVQVHKDGDLIGRVRLADLLGEERVA